MCTTVQAAYKGKVPGPGGIPSISTAAAPSQTPARTVSDPISTPLATSTSAATPQPLMAKKIITGRTMLGGSL